MRNVFMHRFGMLLLVGITVLILFTTPAAAAPAGAETPVVPAMTPDQYINNPEYMLNLDLSTGGRVVIQLYPHVAPGHVERLKQLTRAGFYDGIKFHRVIDGFMAQTGAVSYTHLRAHETVLDLVCRLLLEKKTKHAQNRHLHHVSTGRRTD